MSKGKPMSKNFTYIRKNKNFPDMYLEQEDKINKYVKEHNIDVYKQIEVEINSPDEEKNILQMVQACKIDSTLIVYDLNVFGRTADNILEIVKFLLENIVRIIVIKQNLDLVDNNDMLTKMILGIISMTIGLEKELISIRTKEALTAKKAKGESLGKPKGTIQKSKFDEQRDKIEELLSVGLSVRKIAKLLGYNNHIGLNNYVRKRNIRANINPELDNFAS